jgi:hypothetical protein
MKRDTKEMRFASMWNDPSLGLKRDTNGRFRSKPAVKRRWFKTLRAWNIESLMNQ